MFEGREQSQSPERNKWPCSQGGEESQVLWPQSSLGFLSKGKGKPVEGFKQEVYELTYSVILLGRR